MITKPFLKRLVGLAIALVCLLPASAAAASLEPIGEFDQPVFVTSHPDDPDLLYVVEKGGTIQAYEDGTKTEFLDISERVGSGNEEGLLSIALDPGFATDGRFYTYSVSSDGSQIRIDEFSSDGAVADPGSRRGVIAIPHTFASNHNGGQVQIGPDGYLYAGLGDGGGGGDPQENGQDTSTLLGAIIRIDPDPVAGSPYGIPADNPFVGAAGRDEIWSYGLRNPYRFSFDRASGDLTIADVGQSQREEVDFRTVARGGGRGDNFGWDCREGSQPYDDASPGISCSGLSFVDPVFDYGRDGGACSITGGYVSRDPGTLALAGRYLYADFCVGEVRSVELDATDPAATDRDERLELASPSSFGTDSCGRLYITSLAGSVARIVGDQPTDCSAPSLDPPPPSPPSPSPDPEPPAPDPAPPAEGFAEGPVCEGTGLVGTPASDSFRGSGVADLFAGRGGSDRILGGGGPDCLVGEAGSDLLRGGGGKDLLRGGAGGDRVRGGRGPDRLRGGSGPDRLNGGAGRDRIKAGKGRDRIDARGGGRDLVRCGRGRDRAKVDRFDRVRGCERS